MPRITEYMYSLYKLLEKERKFEWKEKETVKNI